MTALHFSLKNNRTNDLLLKSYHTMIWKVFD